MGNCVSASKGHDSALKFNLSVTDDRPSVLIDESPVDGSAAGIRSSAAQLNGKEEVFFDSQPWLESDCEDYFSVNGETPSCGNSPVHTKKFSEQPLPEKYVSTKADLNSEAEPVVTELKKPLHELFLESFRADPVKGELGGFDLPPINKSPFSPVTVPDHTPDPVKKVNSAQSPRCCIPSLVRSLSFGERKKRMKPVYGSVA